LLLNSSWIPLFARSPRAVTSESDFRHIPEFPVSRSSWLRRFEIPDRRVFATPRLRRFKIPDPRMFATSGLRRFATLENHQCFAPEKHILRTSLNSTFRGWQIFLNSPTMFLIILMPIVSQYISDSASLSYFWMRNMWNCCVWNTETSSWLRLYLGQSTN
jgi:hypothetical protein